MMELEWGAASLQSVKNRPNEDRYRLLGASIPLVAEADRGQLFAVFDGIGSAPKGMDAAQKMCDVLVDFFRGKIVHPPSAESLRQLLMDASLAINNWGCKLGTDMPEGGCAGTLAWFHQQSVVLFQAGDTVGYLLQETRLTRLTRDHGNGKILSNFFGRGRELLIDVFSQAVQESDVLILVTDGVTNALSDQAIAEIVSTHNKGETGPQRAADELCRLAKARGYQNNITAVIIEVVDLGDAM